MLAYFDIFVGISGDMVLGALVDAGLPLSELEKAVAALGLGDDVSLKAETVHKGALRGTKVTVIVHGEPDRPHAHLRVPPVPQQRSSSPPPQGFRPQAYRALDQDHGPHRSLNDVLQIIYRATLPETVKEQAAAVFRRLAEAEARVHGVSPEKIHFHEVGALDAIVDIVGAVAGLHALGVTRIVASPIPSAHGYVQTAHGKLPVPAPATSVLLEGVPVRGLALEGETVTPTGAALIVTLADQFGIMPSMRVKRVAYGAGSMDLPLPNLLRLWLGEVETKHAAHWHVEPLVVLSTNIDDMPGEWFGALMRRLLDEGALDVWYTPIHMKKGRPAVLVNVLAPLDTRLHLREVLVMETTTLGVREMPVERWCVPRHTTEVMTRWGRVRVKVASLPNGTRRPIPEFDDCHTLAEQHGIPLMEVYWEALQLARAQLKADEEVGAAGTVLDNPAE